MRVRVWCVAAWLCAALVPGMAWAAPRLDPAAARARSDSLVDALEAGQYATVETGATQLLAELAQRPPVDSALVVRVWTTLLDTWTRNGKGTRDTTVASAARIVALAERVTPQTPLLAQILQVQGAILLGRARYADARDVLVRADALLQETVPPDDPRRGWCQSTLGNACQRLGQPAQAQAHYRRALDILTHAYGDSDTRPARVATNLAFSLHSSGDDAGARDAYDRALALFERALPPTHPDLAVILGGYGSFLKDTGDFLAARGYLERALAIRQASSAPESPAVARVLFNLSTVRLDLADTTGARQGYQHALAIFRAAEGAGGGPFTTLTLINLGETLLKSGDWAGGRAAIGEAVALRTRLGLTDDADILTALLLQAYLDLRDGRAAEARAALDTCVAVNRRVHGTESQGSNRRLAAYAAAAWACGDSADAADSAWQAADRAARQLRALIRVLPERQALLSAGQSVPGYDLTIDIAAHTALDAARQRRAFDTVVRTRALVLDELAARRPAGGDGDTLAARRWEDAARAYSHLLVRGPGAEGAEAYQARLDSARVEFERAESGVARRRQHARREGAGADAVARALPAGSALVGFVVYQHARFAVMDSTAPASAAAMLAGVPALTPEYAAFVVRAGETTPRVVRLGDAAPIEAAVQRWREEMLASAREGVTPARAASARRAGAALRRRVWDPLAAALGGATRVFLVPDGALHLVAFDALPVGAAGFLVETGPLLHYLSAERDLAAVHEAADARGLLAVGDADFDARSGDAPAEASATRGASCAALASLRFAPLPGTREELRQVRAVWASAAAASPAAVLTRDAATEASFKAQAPGHAVVHVATHGFFLAEGCAPAASDSLRGIGGMRPHTAVAAAATGDNPLALAGLAFAGANRHDGASEDGVLTAQEVAALDLRGTQWAVLSACESGVGRVQEGEGVLGLRRAFVIAGARTVVTSLWPVRDAATAAWMRTLYRARFVDGRDTAEAMRAARRSALRECRVRGIPPHPALWAAFVAAGDWR